MAARSGEVNRPAMAALAERLRELGLERGRIGVCGLGLRDAHAAEGTIFHGTFLALQEALPDAEFVPRPTCCRRYDRSRARKRSMCCSAR